jgi:hypothetical protein
MFRKNGADESATFTNSAMILTGCVKLQFDGLNFMLICYLSNCASVRACMGACLRA